MSLRRARLAKLAVTDAKRGRGPAVLPRLASEVPSRGVVPYRIT